MYVERQIRSTLNRARKQFPAVLVTGPRQSGKTTFLRHSLGARARYVTFDDPMERQFALHDPEGFLDRFEGRAAILDEVQYVPELFPHLKMRIDRARRQNGRWFLTGSQRFQLMASVGESLAGRLAVLELLPFSLAEVSGSLSKDLATILWDGLYPEPAIEPAKRDLWVSSYVQTYVERDVRQLRNVQDLRLFQTLISLCAANHGQELNVASLSRTIGISEPALKSWITVLEASYLTLRLPPYFENLGKRVIKTPKLYFLDSALVCSLTRQPGAAAALAGAMGGHLFEGLIVAEAWKTFAARGQPADVHFWRSHDGIEVDLLVRANGVLIPVEIKLTSTPTVGHLKPLERFKDIAGRKAASQGVLVCRVGHRTPLPNGNIALPWSEFGSWLGRILA